MCHSGSITVGFIGASKPNSEAGHRLGGQNNAEFWPHLITHVESEAEPKSLAVHSLVIGRVTEHQRSEDKLTELLAGLAPA